MLHAEESPVVSNIDQFYTTLLYITQGTYYELFPGVSTQQVKYVFNKICHIKIK